MAIAVVKGDCFVHVTLLTPAEAVTKVKGATDAGDPPEDAAVIEPLLVDFLEGKAKGVPHQKKVKYKFTNPKFHELASEREWLIEVEDPPHATVACNGKTFFAYLDKKAVPKVKLYLEVKRAHEVGASFELKNPPPDDSAPDGDEDNHPPGDTPVDSDDAPGDPASVPADADATDPSAPADANSGNPPAAPGPASGPAAPNTGAAQSTNVNAITSALQGTNLNAPTGPAAPATGNVGPPGAPVAGANNPFRDITVATTGNKMTTIALADLFTRDISGNGALFSNPLVPDDRIVQSWEAEDPPRFRLVDAEYMKWAIWYYHRQQWNTFGTLTILPVIPSARDDPGRIIAPNQAGTAPVDTTIHPGQPILTLPNRNNFNASQAPNGSPGNVFANYVEISQWPSTIYQYSINWGGVQTGWDNNLDPVFRPISRLRVKENIMKILKSPQGSPLLQGNNWGTDFNSIFSLVPLWSHTAPRQQQIIGPVIFRKNDGRLEEHGPYVTLTYVVTLNLPTGGAFNLPAAYPNRAQIVEAFNAFCSENAKAHAHNNHVELVGANKFFDSRDYQELGQGNFLAYRGFSLSTRPTTSQLLLSIAPITSAFLRPCTVKHWLDNLVNNGWALEDAMKTLLGVRCRVIHRRPTRNVGDPNPNLEDNRHKVITEFGKLISGPNAGQQPYKPRNHPAGAALPYVSAFFTTLIAADAAGFNGAHCVNVGLKLDYNGPANSEPSKVQRRSAPGMYNNLEEAIWIPSNLLEIEPHQMYTKILTGTYSANMITVACKTPAQNRAWVEQRGLGFLGVVPPAATPNWMSNLGIQIGTSLIQVPVTKLNMPMIMFNGSNETLRFGPSWNLARKTFRQGATVNALRFIRITCTQEGKHPAAHNSNHIYTALRQAFHNHGIGLTQPPGAHGASPNPQILLDIPSTTSDSMFNPPIWNLFANGARFAQPSDVHIVILPTNSAGVFAAVKRAADFHGLHTVCILTEKADKCRWVHGQQVFNLDVPTFSNLCLKINAKAAMPTHHVSTINTRQTVFQDTIVLGADIGKMRGGEAGTPNIASVVGTVDRFCVHMPGSMRPIPAKADMIPTTAMTGMVHERLTAWKDKNNGRLPRNILYYRDGVSQSQYTQAMQELRGIEIAYDQINHSLRQDLQNVNPPNINLIIVGKRHNTRFFPATNNQEVGRGNGNLAGGHLINSGVTLFNEAPVIYNFFLQSHTAIQGTARTAHYVVLQNDMNLSQNEFHEITFALCFAYPRATKGVSYCAPAYHADRLCTRGEAYMRRTSAILSADTVNNPWWKTNMPQPNALQAQWQAWYNTIAANVASHHEWLGQRAVRHDDPRPAGHTAAMPPPRPRTNPWHPNFNNSMFYI